ncbi:MAG: RNA polymerase sigma factor [Geminicoccaceae bacterium]
MTADIWLGARFAAIRPKALAALARQFRDVDLAEEVFATACERALKAWPETGLPDDPFAWLLKVGRNAGLDIIRKNRRGTMLEPELVADAGAEDMVEDMYVLRIDQDGLRDDVLRLLFICCHPALAQQNQLALALKIIAGMSVDQIAGAFLVKPKTMEQRITRAKRTVAGADIPFETPDLTERGRRIKAVSLMLYLLFNEGWSATSGTVHIKAPLCEEAIRLARLLLGFFPGQSELMGLLSLFLFQHSRSNARLDEAGDLVALEDQDWARWDYGMIAEGRALLEKALRHGPPGRYQIQAAIAAVHANAGDKKETDWAEIGRLYEALYAIDPTPVIRLNQAAAIANVEGPRAALDMIDPLAEQLGGYRWYHAARAALLLELGANAKAKHAFEEALCLRPTEPERRYLMARIAECEKKI